MKIPPTTHQIWTMIRILDVGSLIKVKWTLQGRLLWSKIQQFQVLSMIRKFARKSLLFMERYLQLQFLRKCFGRTPPPLTTLVQDPPPGLLLLNMRPKK